MLHEAYSLPKLIEVSSLSATRRNDDRKAILLVTATIAIVDRHGDPHMVKPLIDQGSEMSIISKALVQ